MTNFCRLCGSHNLEPFYPEKGIVRCSQCDLVFAIVPDDVDVTEIYEDGDYFHGGEYQNYEEDKLAIQKNFSYRINDLKKMKPSGKLLEIGCAFGYFLELAAEHWDVVGVDITKQGVKSVQERGLDARLGDFCSMDFGAEKFELICMWDTVEHLENPFEFIKKAESLLAPGGYFILTTGNVDSFVSRFRGVNWRLVHPPSHLYYFSPKTLTTAMEKAGMKFHDVSHVGYSRFYKSMVHNVLGSDKSLLYQMATMKGKINFPVYLNLYDIMMYVGKKA